MSEGPASTGPERDALIEAVASAWRARDNEGRIRSEPAWHDLDEAGRVEAYRAGVLHRAMEAALDSRGLSATGRAVMARIAGAG